MVCENFDAGWIDGAKIDNADWYSNNGPTIEQGEGVASSWGIGTSNNIFIWKTQAFNWADPSLAGVVFQLDFETDGSAQFDDDRVGWQTSNSDINSNLIFGVQLDNRAAIAELKATGTMSTIREMMMVGRRSSTWTVQVWREIAGIA